MKKTNILKVLMTLTLAIVITGAFAQTNDGDWAGNATVGKYDQSAAAPITDYTTVTHADYITTGKTMPFWVWPSAVYNPNWDYNPAAFVDPTFPTQGELETGVQSTFAWQVGTGADNAAAFAALAADGSSTTNYIEITAGAAGTVTLMEVIESSPTTACPGDEVYFGFTSIAEPSVTITNATATEYGLNNVIGSACGTAATGVTAAITATFLPAEESANYHINMPYTVYNATLDGTGNIVLGADITGAATVNVFGVDGATVPSAANPIVNAKTSPIVASQTYVLENDLITVYEFTYNNTNAAISRKSDYIAARAGGWVGTDYANFSYYPAAPAGTNYYIIVLPTPVTGPIYHISNTFAY